MNVLFIPHLKFYVMKENWLKIKNPRDFPAGPVAKTPHFPMPGLTPGEGTRSHIPQLKRKIPHATAKTRNSQINTL